MGENTGSGRTPLRFKGDWGGANLTRAAGWFAQWVWEHTPDHRLSVIHTGRGMGDNLEAVADGSIDVALATPGSFARLAREGRGPFEGRALPGLVAIGVFSHRDAMIPVVRADLGLRTLADVAAYDGPLRISLGLDDPNGFMGLAGNMVLETAGIDLARVVGNGGSITRHERPFDSVADLRDGRADLMVSEAIMTPDWQRMAQERDVSFLSLTDDEAEVLKRRWDIDTIELRPGYFAGADHPITAMDYGDWIVVASQDLEDEIAALLARAFIENGQAIARGYQHLPLEYSPLRYPIDFRVASLTPIPLHPGAQQAYDLADGLEKT